MENNLECPHCSVMAYMDWNTQRLSVPRSRVKEYYSNQGDLPTLANDEWYVHYVACPNPNCRELIIMLERRRPNDSLEYFAHPRFPKSESIGSEVPEPLRKDYEEAHAVLSISPKASAVLSRRILQEILREHGYESRSLSTQINDVLNEEEPMRSLPPTLYKTIDAVRHFGNFAAHPVADKTTLPLTDKTTLQVIEVESGEAEWCLRIIVELFDHYYVKPANTRKALDALNETLQKAGKPPMRGS